MRIVDINNIYSDVGGGVRTYHQQKLQYFAAHPEHSYAMIVPGAVSRTVEHPGGRLHYVRGFGVATKDSGPGYSMMADPFRVWRLFEREQPDAVEIGGPYHEMLLGRLPRLRSDPLLVGFYHLEFRDAHIEPRIARWPAPARRAVMGFFDGALRLAYQRGLDATFVASEVVRRELAEIGVTNTVLTPLGVDLERYDPGRRSEAVRAGWGAGPGDRVLLHAGRLSVEKGTGTILEASDRLLEDERVHIVMAGRGGLAADVAARAGRHPRLHFLSYVKDPEELGAAFASADAYLATGPYETFGLAVLEALASGLPVVATDEGAGAELALASGAGVTFCARDPESLVERTRELLAGDLGELGRKGRAYAEVNGSWSRTFDLMVESYERLLAVRRRRGR